MFYEFVNFGSNNCFKNYKGKNPVYSAHLHRSFEIIITLSGEIQLTVDNKDFSLKENDAIFIFPNQIHSLYSQKSEYLSFIVSPELIKEYSNKTKGVVPVNNVFCPSKYLVDELERISEDANIYEKKGVLYSFCGQFDKTAKYESEKIYHDGILYKIFMFVEENFGGECTLEKLSSEIGYNYSYLSRFFKKSVGIPFKTYVNEYRLSHVCYLLGNSDTSIMNCAVESGFDSIRTFNRNFKMQYGITPEQYRDSIKGN